MALIKEGVTYRNIQEQVKKNKDDIDAIRQGNLLMAQMGIKVVGHVSDVSELPDPATYEGDYGDAFTIGEEKPYNFYIFTRPANGVENPYWFDLGEFPARGPRGETGATGPVGPQGQSGLSLVAKTYDPNAASGQYIPGTPWVNVVTGNVFISNEDFTWTQVGNWKGPQGSTGLTGPTGATGPQGLTGPQGPRGEAGGFANFKGILTNENLLPNPELMNKSDGFLVGSQPPYDVYVIIGDENNKATWQWANVASTALPSMIVITAPTGILSEDEMVMIAQNDHVIITDNVHIYKKSEKIVDPNQGTEYWFVCVEVNDEFSNTILKIQVLSDGHYDTYTNALGSSYGVGSFQVNTFNKLHASSDLTVEGNAHFQEDLTVDGTIHGKLANLENVDLTGGSGYLTEDQYNLLNGSNACTITNDNKTYFKSATDSTYIYYSCIYSRNIYTMTITKSNKSWRVASRSVYAQSPAIDNVMTINSNLIDVLSYCILLVTNSYNGKLLTVSMTVRQKQALTIDGNYVASLKEGYKPIAYVFGDCSSLENGRQNCRIDTDGTIRINADAASSGESQDKTITFTFAN